MEDFESVIDMKNEMLRDLRMENLRYWSALDQIISEYQIGNGNPTEMYKIATEALNKG